MTAHSELIAEVKEGLSTGYVPRHLVEKLVFEFESQVKRIAELKTQRDGLMGMISDFVSETCRCPHKTGAASHYPGCPQIRLDTIAAQAKRIAELEVALSKSRDTCTVRLLVAPEGTK